MPRIKDITTDSSLNSTDKLLGTDVSGATRNYLLGDIAAFGNLGATGFKTVTHSTNTHTIDLSQTANNYDVSAQNATNTITFSNVTSNVIGKTGTSDYNKDLWFIGERNNLTTGIWYGHDDFKKTIFGAGQCILTWKEYMDSINL